MNINELRDKVATKLAANPSLKTGMLAEALGVPEADVLRAMPAGYATQLAVTDLAEFITKLEELGLVYFVTRNGACIVEIKGRFGGFSRSGPFFNINGEGLHLHLRLSEIASVFCVSPPAKDDAPSWPSIQFYQEDGNVAFKVFLIRSFQEEVGDDYERSIAVLEKLTLAQ